MGRGTDRRGTGALVSADGLIVTVNYMIMGAQDVVVRVLQPLVYAAVSGPAALPSRIKTPVMPKGA